MLDVTHTGNKTFYLYQRVDGKPERIKLGRFPDLSIERARGAARVAKGKIAAGENPQKEKRSIRSEMTFKELFKQYMERYSKKHKRSWKYDEREVPKYLGHWFDRKISSISTQEIRRLHEKLHDENGLYQANRVLERIRGIYNKAIEWGWEGQNPTNGIKKYREKSRDRFIQPEEMKRFFEALDEEPNETARDYFKVLLFTGARKTNVLAMRWEEISWQAATWRIPETKNGEPVTVPISTYAKEVLEKRKEANQENSPWVFPGTGKGGHLNDPKKAWNRILTNAEIKDLRIHDLRRTFGSYQAATGASPYVIGKSLGHKSQEATQIYARLNLDPVRNSVELATRAMLEAGENR